MVLYGKVDKVNQKYYSNIKSLVRLRSQAEESAELRTPKGLLLTGPPGCGKSFLVDLWFSTLPTPFKTRKHYSELVLEIYRGVWEETKYRRALKYSGVESRQEDSGPVLRPGWARALRTQWRKLLASGSLPKSWKSTAYHDANIYSASYPHILPPISFEIAHRLVSYYWLLVFDELQLLDVSSAGLLADVLSWSWRMGGVIVASSNKVPDELYRGGVQRERLEPFVEALKERCPVLEVHGSKDWRRVTAAGEDRKMPFWVTSQQSHAFWDCVNGLTNGPSSTKRELSVFGRRLVIPRSAGSVCRFTFAELCDEALGPADYITIAAHYRTVIIISIPILGLSAKNQSRRFISLIGALYEMMAEVHNDALSDDQLMAEAFSDSREAFRPNVSSYTDKPERPTASPLSLDALSIFSGEEERFAYKRALSRLIEMTSGQYATVEQWSPLTPSRRKWESPTRNSQPNTSNSRPINSSLASQAKREALESCASGVGPLDSQSDFAAEAAYESETCSERTARERQSAPRLGENHVWGVREDWGDRAGRWGKGAAAFDRDRDEERTRK